MAHEDPFVKKLFGFDQELFDRYSQGFTPVLPANLKIIEDKGEQNRRLHTLQLQIVACHDCPPGTNFDPVHFVSHFLHKAFDLDTVKDELKRYILKYGMELARMLEHYLPADILALDQIMRSSIASWLNDQIDSDAPFNWLVTYVWCRSLNLQAAFIFEKSVLYTRPVARKPQLQQVAFLPTISGDLLPVVGDRSSTMNILVFHPSIPAPRLPTYTFNVATHHTRVQLVDKATGQAQTLPSDLDYLKGFNLPTRRQIPIFERPETEVLPTETEFLRQKLEEQQKELDSMKAIAKMREQDLDEQNLLFAQEARRHQEELGHYQDYIEELKEAYHYLSVAYAAALHTARKAGAHMVMGEAAISSALAQLADGAPALPAFHSQRTHTTQSKPITIQPSANKPLFPCKVAGCPVYFVEEADRDEHRRDQHPKQRGLKLCMVAGCRFTCLDPKEFKLHGDLVHPPTQQSAGSTSIGGATATIVGSATVQSATGGTDPTAKKTARKSTGGRSKKKTESQPTSPAEPIVPASQGDPAQTQGDAGTPGDASQLAQGDPGQQADPDEEQDDPAQEEEEASSSSKSKVIDKILAYQSYGLKAKTIAYCKASNIQADISDDDDYALDWHSTRHTCRHHKCTSRGAFSSYKNFGDHVGLHTYMFICPWCRSTDRMIHKRNLTRHVNKCDAALAASGGKAITWADCVKERQKWEPTIIQDLIKAKLKSAEDRQAGQVVPQTPTPKKRKSSSSSTGERRSVRRRIAAEEETTSLADTHPQPEPTVDPTQDETSGQQAEEEVQGEAEAQGSPRLGHHSLDDDGYEAYMADTDEEMEEIVMESPRVRLARQAPIQFAFSVDDLVIPDFIDNTRVPVRPASVSEIRPEHAAGDTIAVLSDSDVPAAGSAKIEPTDAAQRTQETPIQQDPVEVKVDPTEEQPTPAPTTTEEQGTTASPQASSQEQPSAQ